MIAYTGIVNGQTDAWLETMMMSAVEDVLMSVIVLMSFGKDDAAKDLLETALSRAASTYIRAASSRVGGVDIVIDAKYGRGDQARCDNPVNLVDAEFEVAVTLPPPLAPAERPRVQQTKTR